MKKLPEKLLMPFCVFMSAGLLIFLFSWIKLHLEHPEIEALIIKVVVALVFVISGIIVGIQLRKFLLREKLEEIMDGWIDITERMPDKSEHRPNSEGGYKNPIPRRPNILVSTSLGRVFETLYCNFGWANLRGGEKVLAWQPLPKPYAMPMRQETVEKIKDLVKGVEVDLDSPL